MAEQQTPSFDDRNIARDDVKDTDSEDVAIVTFMDGIKTRIRSPVQIQRSQRLKALCIGLRDLLVNLSLSLSLPINRVQSHYCTFLSRTDVSL